jgi:chemotaxis protein CheX
MNKSTAAVLDEVQNYLQSSVCDGFNTMLTVEAQPAPPPDLRASPESIVAGSVGFAGDVTGVVYLHVTAPFARTLASRLLGLSEAELSDDSMVNDAIGELSKMVVGNFESNLCDAGLTCKLSPPNIRRTADLKLRVSEGALAERLGFRAPDIDLFVDLNVNPWNG